MGKSFLLRAIAGEGRAKGLFVLTGQTQASEIPQPFYLLQRVLRSLMDLTASQTDPAEGRTSGGVGLVGAYSKDRKSIPMMLLPLGLSTESPEEREARLLATLSGRETDEEEEQMALFDRLADHLEEAAGERRLLLILDDLHYADRASIEFLEYYARRAKGRNVKIIATCRPEEEIPERLSSVLNGMSREGLLHKLTLRNLTEPESRELISHISRGLAPSEEVTKEWFALSKGNPLVLEQLARLGSPRTRGATEVTGKTRAQTIFASLTDSERKGLAYATVMGRSFKFHTLYRSLGGDEEKLTETVDSFIQKGLLKETSPETYEFASDELWTEAFNQLTERHRRILHGKIAQAVETTEMGNPLATFELANHYHAARNYEKSLQYNRLAGDIAKKSRDCEARIHYLEQALQALRTQPGRDRKLEEGMVIDMAVCLDTLGEVDRALALLKNELSPGLMTLYYARILTHGGRWKDAEEIALGGLAAIEKSGDPALVGMAYRMLGSIATYRGNYEDAAQHYERAVESLATAGLRAEAAISRLMMADKKRYLSSVDEASIEASYKEAIEELRLEDSPILLATALMNFGLWYVERNMVEDGLAYLEDGLKEAKNSKDARLTGWALFNLADVLLSAGDSERALELNAEAREKLKKVGDKLGLIQVHLVQGRLLGQKGEFEVADLEILEAFRLSKEVGFEPDQLEVLYRQGELYLLKGDREGARKRLAEIDAREFVKLRPDLKRDIDHFRDSLEK